MICPKCDGHMEYNGAWVCDDCGKKYKNALEVCGIKVGIAQDALAEIDTSNPYAELPDEAVLPPEAKYRLQSIGLQITAGMMAIEAAYREASDAMIEEVGRG